MTRSSSPFGRHAAVAIALVGLLLLAGCNFAGEPAGPAGPTTATPTPSPSPSSPFSSPGSGSTAATLTPTPPPSPPNGSTDGDAAGTDASGIAVRGGSLPPGIDPDRVYDRVLAVTGTDAPAPGSVELVNRSEFDGTVLAPRTPAFWRLLGVTPAPARANGTADLENGAVTPLGGVFLLLPENATAARARTLLAHEFVHYAQFQRGRLTALNRRLGSTTDERFVRRAMLEGFAVYATDSYVDRYRPDGYPNSALYDRVEALFPAGSRQRYGTLAYTAGRDHLRERYDDPAAAWAVFEGPPATAEQVLHGAGDPPAPLSVTVRAPEYRSAGRDTLGEAFVRTALRNGLNRSRAHRAAAGWGNDTLVRLRADGRRSFVWALRWDDPDDAAGFVAALRDSLDARASPAGDDRWRLTDRTVGLARAEDLVLLVAGNDSFVDFEFDYAGDRGRVIVTPARAPNGVNGTVGDRRGRLGSR